MSPKDYTLLGNSKENLDRKLDHAIEGTFPTSDPVSVSITKGGAIDYDAKDAAAPASTAPGGLRSEAQHAAENVLGHAKATLAGVAGSASDTAREVYDWGKHYARAAREHYPEAERYYQEGTQAVRQQAAENPLLTCSSVSALGMCSPG